MKNKKRIILACKTIAEKYRNPKGHTFFTESDCPLCQVVLKRSASCAGCPLSNKDNSGGCTDFVSFVEARDSFGDDLWRVTPHTQIAFNKRAEFFDKIIPILESLPPERFTKKGWKYTGDLIPREW